jgi:hypothetical protein
LPYNGAMQICKAFLVTGAAACLVVATAHATDTPADARLREALRQKLAEMDAAAVAPPATATPAPTTMITTVVKAAPAADPTLALPTGQDDAQTARLREALRTRMAADMVTPVGPAPVAKATPAPAPAPMVAPPLPISGTKEERLAEILRQYKADQITPLQYHTQRAKILAE